MIEIWPRLFVGSAADYEKNVKGEVGWYVVQACKEPYHRQALCYRDNGAPKDHPEYLFAERNGRLILNIVDAADPAFFREAMIEKAISFIGYHLRQGRKVLVHCNEGKSRAPSIALLYLRRSGNMHGGFDLCEVMFKERYYPDYAPKSGIRGYLMKHWRDPAPERFGYPPEPRPPYPALVEE